jgi:predicted nucleic acid-binding protein
LSDKADQHIEAFKEFRREIKDALKSNFTWALSKEEREVLNSEAGTILFEHAQQKLSKMQFMPEYDMREHLMEKAIALYLLHRDKIIQAAQIGFRWTS